MGWSQTEGRCKKHPKHKQSPGVCSYCLSERLSQLSCASSSTASNNAASSSCSSSSLSSCSSLSASSTASPLFHLPSSTAAGRLFGRSRTVAVFVRDGDVVAVEKAKKKRGFWSKLLRPNGGRRTDHVFLHSKTVREAILEKALK